MGSGFSGETKNNVAYFYMTDMAMIQQYVTHIERKKERKKERKIVDRQIELGSR